MGASGGGWGGGAEKKKDQRSFLKENVLVSKGVDRKRLQRPEKTAKKKRKQRITRGKGRPSMKQGGKEMVNRGGGSVGLRGCADGEEGRAHLQGQVTDHFVKKA